MTPQERRKDRKAKKRAEIAAKQARATAEFTPHDPAWGHYQSGAGILRDRRLEGMSASFVSLRGGRADGNK